MSAFRAHILSKDSIFVSGLVEAYSTEPEIELTGSSVDPDDVFDHVGKNAPDLLLVDLELPDLTGAVNAAIVSSGFPTLSIIALYDYESDDHVFASLETGAAASAPKTIAPDDLTTLMKNVCHGEWPIYERVLDMPNVAARLAQILSRTWVAAQPVRPVLTTLTNREQNVLNQLAEGVPSTDIAGSLEMSNKGLLTVVRSVVAKLTENRVALQIAEVCTA